MTNRLLLSFLFVLSNPFCATGIGQTPATRPATQQKTAPNEAAAVKVERWASWRGPFGNGTADESANPPTQWSETQNVKWKIPLNGLGHSSPIVWGDKIFLTSAVPHGNKFAPIADGAPGSHDNLKVSQRHKYVVVAVDRKNGKTLWEKTVNENVPHEGAHISASLASASPVTDGKRVYASFGSHGVYCLDFDGNIVWKKQLGQMNTKHAHGEGASPALGRDSLLINWDHEGQSFVIAFDKKTGTERWKKKRSEVTSWASPIIVEFKGREQAIVAGTKSIRSYDMKDGSTIWECRGLSNNVVATPVYANGIVIAGSSYDTKNIISIQMENAKGDITGSENVLWSKQTRTPYVPSPLLYKGYVYYLLHYQGVLTRQDAATGAELSGPFRLNGLREIYASPAAAADRLYVTGRSGMTFVISHVDIPKLHSINKLEDSFSASPAIVGNELIMRGENFLYCLKNK
jgi:outer membrane protein assembly factor BamB